MENESKKGMCDENDSCDSMKKNLHFQKGELESQLSYQYSIDIEKLDDFSFSFCNT